LIEWQKRLRAEAHPSVWLRAKTAEKTAVAGAAGEYSGERKPAGEYRFDPGVRNRLMGRIKTCR
jgi:hypothetical protein